MRIVDEFNARGLKITVFIFEEKYQVKLQNPHFELVLKYRENQVPSKAKIVQYLTAIPDDLWLDDIARLEKFRSAILTPPRDSYEDPEII